jgi:hypothetical protein
LEEEGVEEHSAEEEMIGDPIDKQRLMSLKALNFSEEVAVA